MGRCPSRLFGSFLRSWREETFYSILYALVSISQRLNDMGVVRVVDDCTLRFNVGGDTLRSAFLFSGMLDRVLQLRWV